MKKLFQLIAFLLLIQTVSKAQGDLQFNQVLTYQGNVAYNVGPNSNAYGEGSQWTVPSNKVWKIENKSRTPNGLLRFSINGYLQSDLYERSAYPYYNSVAVDNSPIWLKANDVIKFIVSGSSGNGWGFTGSESYFISIIEYNIVP